MVMEMAVMRSDAMEMADPNAGFGPPPPMTAEVAAVQIRKDFPETWLWENILNLEWFVLDLF